MAVTLGLAFMVGLVLGIAIGVYVMDREWRRSQDEALAAFVDQEDEHNRDIARLMEVQQPETSVVAEVHARMLDVARRN